MTEPKKRSTGIKKQKKRAFVLDFVNKYVVGALTPIVLMLAGIFYLVVLRFLPIRRPLAMIKAMLFSENGGSGSSKGISPFRSVTMALAGTLGVGNIVGVASAIAIGGFGSVFWMWISALAAMILKYAEITLSVAHRRKRGAENYGGAMYYIEDHFAKEGRRGYGKAVGWVFAALCVAVSFGIGCMMQVNAVSGSFDGVLGIPGWACGAVFVLMTALIIKKGARGISGLTEWLVPIMSLGYIIISVSVMISCRSDLPEAIEMIFKDAFSFDSTVGGVVGFLFSDALRYGAMRGLLSNEGGCGTAPFAHAASNTREPAKQGVWGIFEVFVDTIILCTMTAVVIILNYDEVCMYSSNGIMMTVKAYSSVLGKNAEYFLCMAVLLFAYATVICWAHYGMECINYMFKGKKRATDIYAVAFCIAAFLGAVIAPETVWGIADLSMGSMTIINVAVICFMSGEVRELTAQYFRRK